MNLSSDDDDDDGGDFSSRSVDDGDGSLNEDDRKELYSQNHESRFDNRLSNNMNGYHKNLHFDDCDDDDNEIHVRKSEDDINLYAFIDNHSNKMGNLSDDVDSDEDDDNIEWEDANSFKLSSDDESEHEMIAGRNKDWFTSSTNSFVNSRNIELDLLGPDGHTHENTAANSVCDARSNKVKGSSTLNGVVKNYQTDAISQLEQYQPKRKRQKRLNVLRNNALPHHVIELVNNIHKSHMLCLSSRAIQVSSKSCLLGEKIENIGGEEITSSLLLHVAYSLIPFQFTESVTAKNSDSLPDSITFKKICDWFFQFIHNSSTRRDHGRNDIIHQRTINHRHMDGSIRFGSNSRIRSPRSTTSRSNMSKTISQNTTISKKTPLVSVRQSPIPSTHRLLDILNVIATQQQNPTNEDGVNISYLETVLLFLCFVRSLGWRARYVTAIDPIQQHVNANHPIFTSCLRYMFHAILSGKGNSSSIPLQTLTKIQTNKSKRNHVEIFTKQNNKTSYEYTSKASNITMANDGLHNVQDYYLEFSWVEVLICVESPNGIESINTKEFASARPQQRWIHFDPNLNIFDQPLSVEEMRAQVSGDHQQYQQHRQQPSSKRKNKRDNEMKNLLSKTDNSSEYSSAFSLLPSKIHKGGKALVPVSFVLAVEQMNDDLGVITRNTTSDSSFSTLDQKEGYKEIPLLDFITTKLTDVTPRYAHSWSKTLRLRGSTGKEISKNEGKCGNKWWADTIRKTNRMCRRRRQSLRKREGISFCQDRRDGFGQMRSDNIDDSTTILRLGRRKIAGSQVKSSSQVKNIICVDGDSDSEVEENTRKHNGVRNSMRENDEDVMENDEFEKLKRREPIPTNKAAFKNNPFYAIPSTLNSREVLLPDAKKRICGIFKGELVYRRRDVSTALTPKNWLYTGRKVKEEELSKPIKIVKARSKPIKKGFQTLRSYGVSNVEMQKDSKEDILKRMHEEDFHGKYLLYGRWQTDAWSPPPVHPNDVIPVNDHGNVELELINPGLVHLEKSRIAFVSKKLGIPYAPCLIGFEGHGGNRTPTIRGIVVHEHNAEILMEAHTEYESQLVEQDHQEKQRNIYKRWKRLIVGMMTQDRLDKEYAND